MNVINQAIIEELLISPLSIESKYLQAIAMSAFLAFTQKSPLSTTSYSSAYAVDPKTGQRSTDNFKPGSVGVVAINGPIVSASDPWNGIMGTIEAAAQLMQLQADPNICACVLAMESGGGAVYAIKPMADMLRNRSKPVVIHSKTVLASAAMRLAAECDHIMMYHPQGIVGSVGTMYSGQDLQPMFEKWGVNFFEYYAPDSSLKNKTYNDAKKGDGEALMNKVLAPLNDLFIADMKDLRGHMLDAKNKEIFKGETFFAQQAIPMGLIDSLGEMSDAINMAVAIAAGKQPSALTPNSNTMFGLNKFKAISALTAETVTPELIKAANEELVAEKINGVTIVADSELEQLTAKAGVDPTAAATIKTLTDAKAAVDADLATAKAANKVSTDALTAATAKNTELQNQLTAANARIKALGGEPAAAPTGGAKAGVDPLAGDPSPKSKTYCEADAALAKEREKMGFKIPGGEQKGKINGLNEGFYPAVKK